MMVISGPLNEGIKKWNSEFKKKKDQDMKKWGLNTKESNINMKQWNHCEGTNQWDIFYYLTF